MCYSHITHERKNTNMDVRGTGRRKPQPSVNISYTVSLRICAEMTSLRDCPACGWWLARPYLYSYKSFLIARDF